MTTPQTKQALQKSQQLIKAKRYKEAHTLLKTIDHPKAREWQSKLEARGVGQTAKKSTQADNSRPRWLLPVALLVLVLVIGAAAALVLSNSGAQNDAVASTRLFTVCLDEGGTGCSDWSDAAWDAGQSEIMQCHRDNADDGDFVACLQQNAIMIPGG